MARIICRLIRWRHDDSGWTLNDRDTALLRADQPLAAYFDSVAAEGSRGWQQERQSIINVAREAAKSDDPAVRLRMLDVEGVKALLPCWRAWGQVLIEMADHY